MNIPMMTSPSPNQKGVAYLILYILLDWVSYIHPILPLAITPWNPPPGLSLAFLLLYGARQWPWLFVAALLAEILVREVPVSWGWLAASSAALTFCYTGLAVFLRRVLIVDPRLRSLRDLTWLIAGCLVGGLLAALAYVGLYTMAGIVSPGDFIANLLRFWLGDVIGLLVMLPLLLVLAGHDVRRFHLNRETVLQGGSLFLALWIIFGIDYTDEFKFFYLLFLPLVWIATRHGILGATVALMATQIGLIIALQWSGHHASTVMEFQMLMLGLTVTGLFLGMTVSIRRSMEDTLHQRESDLNQALRLAAAGEMAQALAHELNQPLSALANYARAGRMMQNSPETHAALLAETLDKIADEAGRAGQVVHRLREFFRGGSLRLERMTPVAIVEDGLAPLRKRMERHGIELQIRLAAHLPIVLADRVQMATVIHNLAGNAIDAMKAGGDARRELIVSAEAAMDGNVRFCVADSGPGIAPELHEKLFQPFATSKPEGMGLGLAISRTLVAAHGGRLELESTRPTRFCFTLPVEEPGTHDPN